MERPFDVLVVDDCEETALAVSEALSRLENCESRYVLGVAEARVAMRLRAPDMVVADLVMGSFYGDDLLEHISAEHPSVLRILHTSSANQDLDALVLVGVAHAVVTKDANHESLVEVVRALRGRQARHQNRCSAETQAAADRG